jgi:hypothetical protein
VDAPEGEEDDRLDRQKLAQRLERRQLLQAQAVDERSMFELKKYFQPRKSMSGRDENKVIL